MSVADDDNHGLCKVRRHFCTSLMLPLFLMILMDDGDDDVSVSGCDCCVLSCYHHQFLRQHLGVPSVSATAIFARLAAVASGTSVDPKP